MNPLLSTLGEAFFKRLPNTPGVYFMLGSNERLLYVGKAKGLKARLRSYARLKSGRDEERLLELVAHIREIRWEDHPTELQALTRETELLRVLRPPYNIAGTDEELYLYLGIRERESRPGAQPRLELRLSNWPDIEDEGFEVFGGYRDRRRFKEGYAALLRLLHAYQAQGPRYFSYPAKISREVPPWVYELSFPQELRPYLGEFLRGRSRKLLALIFEGLLRNEDFPAFMRSSVQLDIDRVKLLYRSGLGVMRELKRRHGLRGVVDPETLSEVVEREVRESLLARLNR